MAVRLAAGVRIRSTLTPEMARLASSICIRSAVASESARTAPSISVRSALAAEAARSASSIRVRATVASETARSTASVRIRPALAAEATRSAARVCVRAGEVASPRRPAERVTAGVAERLASVAARTGTGRHSAVSGAAIAGAGGMTRRGSSLQAAGSGEGLSLGSAVRRRQAAVIAFLRCARLAGRLVAAHAVLVERRRVRLCAARLGAELALQVRIRGTVGLVTLAVRPSRVLRVAVRRSQRHISLVVEIGRLALRRVLLARAVGG